MIFFLIYFSVMKIPFECQRTPSVDWVQFYDIPNIVVGKNKFHQTPQTISLLEKLLFVVIQKGRIRNILLFYMNFF